MVALHIPNDTYCSAKFWKYLSKYQSQLAPHSLLHSLHWADPTCLQGSCRTKTQINKPIFEYLQTNLLSLTLDFLFALGTCPRKPTRFPLFTVTLHRWILLFSWALILGLKMIFVAKKLLTFSMIARVCCMLCGRCIALSPELFVICQGIHCRRRRATASLSLQQSRSNSEWCNFLSMFHSFHKMPPVRSLNKRENPLIDSSAEFLCSIAGGSLIKQTLCWPFTTLVYCVCLIAVWGMLGTVVFHLRSMHFLLAVASVMQISPSLESAAGLCDGLHRGTSLASSSAKTSHWKAKFILNGKGSDCKAKIPWPCFEAFAQTEWALSPTHLYWRESEKWNRWEWTSGTSIKMCMCKNWKSKRGSKDWFVHLSKRAAKLFCIKLNFQHPKNDHRSQRLICRLPSTSIDRKALAASCDVNLIS